VSASEPPGGVDVLDDATFRRWPAFAMLALVVLLAFGALGVLLWNWLDVLPELLLFGVLPAAGVVVLLVLIRQAHERGNHDSAHTWAVAMLFIASATVTVTALALVFSLGAEYRKPVVLLAYSVTIWWANVALFAVWYWEIDGGGPHVRMGKPYRNVDFAFPQMQMDDAALRQGWAPNLLDYLFLAFNTSTAFSPSDTMVLSRRAKLLMMWQAGLSLTIVAGLAARAIGTI
jgi:hypothetical protein